MNQARLTRFRKVLGTCALVFATSLAQAQDAAVSGTITRTATDNDRSAVSGVNGRLTRQGESTQGGALTATHAGCCSKQLRPRPWTEPASGQTPRGSRWLAGEVDSKKDRVVGSAKGARGSNPPGANLERIEAELKKVVEASPQNFEANHDLGEFYLQVGKLPEAIPYMEKAYQLDPSHYVNAYDLGLAYLETHDYAAARRHVRLVLTRQNTAELHDLLGEVEEKLGDFVAAVNEYERAAHMDPSENNIFDWGVELLLHQTFEPAVEVFRSGIGRFPKSAKLWIGLGIARYSRGNYDEAVEAFLRATDLNPSEPRPYLFLARMYNVSMTQADAVREKLRRFADIQPNNPQAVYNYALSLWKGNRGQNLPIDLRQVESLLKRSAALDPQYAEPHLQLGILYAGRSEYAEAVREYQRAIKIKPDLVDAHYRLAQAYVHSGDKERAQGELDVYEKLHSKQLVEAERQRAEVRQFVYTLKENRTP